MRRHPRGIVGTALALALVLWPAALQAQPQDASDPEVSPRVTAAPSAGTLPLRRSGPSTELDSFLDTNQPDLYLNVEPPATESSVPGTPDAQALPEAAPAP
ncbi:hypothetical protein D3C86_1165920 [compost metagenome]